MTQDLKILPYTPDYKQELLEVTINSWTPVFPKMEKEIPDYVYQNFYPKGWEKRQIDDVSAMLEDGETEVWLGLKNGKLGGYVGLRVWPEDNMGEIYILSVDPAFQRMGLGSALMQHGFDIFKEKKLSMVMVETGDDEGHAPSRATYEAVGFERYPVARFFRKL